MMIRNRLWITSVTVIAAMAAVLSHSQPAAAQVTGGCCFPGGECVEGPADLCPREQGGTPVAACLGDRNNDGADDACAPPPLCCFPDGFAVCSSPSTATFARRRIPTFPVAQDRNL